MEGCIIYIEKFLDISTIKQETKLCKEIVYSHLADESVRLDFSRCGDLSTLFIKESIIQAMKMIGKPKITVRNISSNNLMALRYLIKEEILKKRSE